MTFTVILQQLKRCHGHTAVQPNECSYCFQQQRQPFICISNGFQSELLNVVEWVLNSGIQAGSQASRLPAECMGQRGICSPQCLARSSWVVAPMGLLEPEATFCGSPVVPGGCKGVVQGLCGLDVLRWAHPASALLLLVLIGSAAGVRRNGNTLVWDIKPKVLYKRFSVDGVLVLS